MIPVWNLPSNMNRTFAKTLLALALVVLAALLPACSDETTENSATSKKTLSNGPNETTSSIEEATLSETTNGTTDEPSLTEGTLNEEPDIPQVVLRLEGAPKTAFRGLCTVGDRNEVLGGEVPQRFTFDLDGQKLICRIQKQNSGNGALRVILLDGDKTRSVQSTKSSGSTINLSYTSG